MSLYGSFYSSLSGLSTNAQALSVIGNDLANLNTIGFKGSNSSFQDLFNSAMGSSGTQGNGNPMQVGMGTRMGAISQNYSQGSFQSTGNVTDMALSGQGFFTLQNSTGGRSYSRAGNFTVDNSGALMDPNGNFVLGWNRIGNALSTNGPIVPITLNMGTTSPPVATTSMTTTTNLNANAAIFNPADPNPDTSSRYSVPVQVYDSLGQAHAVSITYTKTAQNAWSYAITTDDQGDPSATPIIPPPVVTPATGTLTFDDNGNLTAASGSTLAVTITGWTDGAAPMATTWNLTSDGTATGTGLITQFAADSATSNATQDGFAAGNIRSLVVDKNGMITGNFTNGQTVALGQVAISTFSNMNGLSKIGDNTWGETLASGAPNIGPANQGGRGTILGSQLELSNVDVADEFTKLIIAQRGYQANSKIVTTSDQLLQETLNLKQ